MYCQGIQPSDMSFFKNPFEIPTKNFQESHYFRFVKATQYWLLPKHKNHCNDGITLNNAFLKIWLFSGDEISVSDFLIAVACFISW